MIYIELFRQQKDMDNRKFKVEKIKTKTEQLAAEIKIKLAETNTINKSSNNGPSTYNNDLENQALLGEDGEYEDTRNLTNK
jgi:hypothetical protein